MKRILAHSTLLRAEIQSFIAQQRSEIGSSSSWQADFMERLLPFATAGKLLRGSLVCFSYRAFADRPPDQSVIKAAMALELVHSALLIHDDVMDNDDFRRGKPSLHYQYRTLGKQTGLANPVRFGANMAICGADMCLFMALGLLAQLQNETETSQSTIKLFAEKLTEVCDGQMQDIYSQAQTSTPSKQTIYNLMKTKTASYTLSLPLSAGALLAEQPRATIKKLQRIGDATGMIFQIRDDELGIIGNTAKTGKPVGADIREGKKTLIYYYLMKKCNSSEKRILESIFGNPLITSSDITIIQKLIRQHRIRQIINTEVQSLENKALATLETLDLSHQNKAELKSLITFCAKRQA